MGNWLPKGAKLTGANFLSDSIRACVKEREQTTGWGGGMMDRERLHRNMLSSQPLCFNLFGELRRFPHELATALNGILGSDIQCIVDARLEWAPPGAIGGASFDAFIEYSAHDERRGFVAVETKYTEDLTPTKLKDKQEALYRGACADPVHGFVSTAADLLGTDAQQFCINAIEALGHSVRAKFDVCSLLVLHLTDDLAALEAVASVQKVHPRGEDLTRSCSYEAFVQLLPDADQFLSWKKAFTRRYLDLDPIQHVLA